MAIQANDDKEGNYLINRQIYMCLNTSLQIFQKLLELAIKDIYAQYYNN